MQKAETRDPESRGMKSRKRSGESGSGQAEIARSESGLARPHVIFLGIHLVPGDQCLRN